MNLKKYFVKEYGIIKDDYGTTIERGRIRHAQPTFELHGRTYNVYREGVYYDETRGLVTVTRRYFYNVNNPNPLTFHKRSAAFEPLIRPDLYTKMLENEVLIKLNSVKSKFNINLVYIGVGLLVLIVLAYFLSGGSLT